MSYQTRRKVPTGGPNPKLTTLALQRPLGRLGRALSLPSSKQDAGFHRLISEARGLPTRRRPLAKVRLTLTGLRPGYRRGFETLVVLAVNDESQPYGFPYGNANARTPPGKYTRKGESLGISRDPIQTVEHVV